MTQEQITFNMLIFFCQFGLDMIIFLTVGYLFVLSTLAPRSRADKMMWMSLPHALRGVSLVLLAYGIVPQGIPTDWSRATAMGDFVTCLLALGTLIGFAMKWRGALALSV